ncbi:MAG: nitrous oxide-stimulated promoter family protein [Anaerolineae bacterium]|nr:nitrous oxide-stimulated promoter family protein [Anaerolineae bacterium]
MSQSSSPRLQRERITIHAMQVLFCKAKHGYPNGELCADCQSLFDYAMLRLAHCPYQEEKPTCANCPIHCYQKERREQVRVMMRYAGPRMMLRHPVLAVRHLLDGKKKAPQLRRKATTSQTGD